MPEILFDGRKVTVAPGTNLVDAGTQAGVPVPIFCYHKDLGAVGSCRVCACTVKGADGKSRTVMACMTAAQDGMEVTTLDEESVKLRKHVTEWLMLNHPHDCPICDEGGECQLQDLTIACGHSQRRIHLPKRTFQNQYLGEFIVHEMNRCITCYRCARFYQEYAGGRDFSATGSRDRVYFGRFEEGALESPFSGNLVEMCPTGVFTDKLFRYKSRVWDLEIAPSVCPHCSVGCNVLPGARFRELQRVRVRDNPAVNGVFLCDRGQFGHGYVMDPARPLEVRLNQTGGSWDQALGLAGATLLAIAREHGAGSIGLVASSRVSVEGHASLEALAEGAFAGARVAHFDDAPREARALAALLSLRDAGCPTLEQSEIEDCDVLVIAGAVLVDEAPLAALAARQVARKGGAVFVIGPGESYLLDGGLAVPVAPHRIGATLEAVAGALGASGGDEPAAVIGKALAGAQRPGLLLGSDLLDGPAFTAATALAKAIAARGTAPRFGYVFPGPNGFGAAAMSKEAGFAKFTADLEAGKLRAAVLVECEGAAWTARQIEALRKLEMLVVIDYLPGPLADAARVFLPAATTYESEGCYVNRAGRLQSFTRSRTPSLPVRAEFQGSSFPRVYHTAPPLGDARAPWRALEALREAAIGRPEARTLDGVRDALGRSAALWAPIREIAAGSAGAPLDLGAHTPAAADVPAFAASGDGLAVYALDRVLGTEVLSRRSGPIAKMAGAATAWISAEDAKRLGVNGTIGLEIAGRAVELAVRATDTVPAGVVLVPRGAAGAEAPAQGGFARALAHAAR